MKEVLQAKLPSAITTKPDAAREKEILELLTLLEPAKRLQELARRHNIADIFQDNGGKILQTLIMLGLKNTGAREGNDARDVDGNEYELKSANIRLVTGFSTHHHLTHDIIAKYRQVPWVFSFYDDIELQEVWAMTPAQLDPVFQHWEDKLDGNIMKDGVLQPAMAHINNPKIPCKLVKQTGTEIFSIADVKRFLGR